MSVIEKDGTISRGPSDRIEELEAEVERLQVYRNFEESQLLSELAAKDKRIGELEAEVETWKAGCESNMRKLKESASDNEDLRHRIKELEVQLETEDI